MQSKYETAIQVLAEKYNKPVQVIKKIVESQYEFISQEMKNIDFNKAESQKDFDNMKKTFLVKHLFKLTPSWKVINQIRNHNENKSTSNSKS